MKILKAKYEILTPISQNGIEELKRIEAVGRTCYKSEDKITDDGESAKKFVKMLIDNGHCFDDKTEILTSTGWKHYYELSDDDLYATLNKDGFVEYKPKTDYIMKEYHGEMVKVSGSLVDLLVTNKHKMYVCKTTTKKGRKKNDYELIAADELINVSHSYIKNSKGFYPNDVIEIDNNVLKLLGMAVGDGYYNGTALSFHLKKHRKINYIEKICKELKTNYSISTQKDGTIGIYISFTKGSITEYKYLFDDIYDTNNEKQIPCDLLMKLNSNQSICLLEGLLNSDGCTMNQENYETTYYCTTSKRLAGQFQQLCLHCGFSSNNKGDIIPNIKSYGYKPLNKLSVIKRYNKPEINEGKNTKLKIESINNWSGIVWCINLPPYHTLYVRRNGKPVWCGNCAMIEHSQLSVRFYVDRGVSHELVRHRVASFGQESTRYCNYSNNKYNNEISVIDLQDGIILDTKMVKESAGVVAAVYTEWIKAMQDAERHYLKMIELGATPQIARSVLPNSTKTELVMTANYREWRHFFKLRTAIAAHPQMREITIPLLKELKSKIPIIFDDIEIDDRREKND